MIVDRGNSKDHLIANIAEYYPLLYHMAEADTWDSIRKYGLLSTSALLDLFEITDANRYAIESKRRSQSVTISHTEYGSAVIRDQKPMHEKSLLKCLINMSPQQWYEILNRRVFFWPTIDRLNRLLRAYPGQKHTVITADTAQLLERHFDQVTLSRINSGCTRPMAWPRGNDTFLSVPVFPFETRRQKYRRDAIAELAVDYAVSDIVDVVIRVEHVVGTSPVEIIYER